MEKEGNNEVEGKGMILLQLDLLFFIKDELLPAFLLFPKVKPLYPIPPKKIPHFCQCIILHGAFPISYRK